MASTAPSTAPEAAAASGKAKETLSQFVARVLDQLSLSSWLPAAALVLSLAFSFQLATVLEKKQPDLPSPLEAVGAALGRLSDISIGGALLLVVAIVVVSILTQAFAFEAIRTLEGYWGTVRPVEWWAGRRRLHFAEKREQLDNRYSALTQEAWRHARDSLEDLQQGDVTPLVLAYVAAKVKGVDPPNQPLSAAEADALRRIAWDDFAPPEILRRRLNVDKKRRDYPDSRRALPTRLGNILRAHEDETGEREVETFVQRNFDSLPESLQQEHDEQRTRLDLYCSMVFVTAFAATVSALRLSTFEGYVIGSLLVGLVLMWLMYRAALASARAYGLLLISIARHLQDQSG